MKKIKLLDCTLRDGGYINDWDFGLEVIQSLIGSLVKANVDYVELGFLRDCEYDPNKTLFNNVAEAKKLIPQDSGNTKFTLMALHDKYSIEKLEDNDDTVFAIRVTFHDYDINEGLDYIACLMDKGYRVFCNPINIMGYSERELLDLIEKVNRIKPHAFSIVDTFGAMRTRDLLKYLLICESKLDKNIGLGCHLHENMSLALSLSETFIKNISPARDCVIDASLYGMGRVPGNLCIELIANLINEVNDNEHYQIDSILEAIDSHITHVKDKSPWGYSPEYFLSAKYNLHRNYAEHFQAKGNITFKTIDNLLSEIPENKKTAFDKPFAEQLLAKTFAVDSDNMDKFKSIVLDDKKILIIAPGLSAVSEKDKISRFINENNATVFCVNFVSDIYQNSNVFFGNERRFYEYKNMLDNITTKLIISSNISPKNNAIRIDYMKAVDGIAKGTNSVFMLLNLFYLAGVKEVWLAGVDGYSSDSANYMNKLFENRTVLQNQAEKNDKMLQNLTRVNKEISLNFVTSSFYQDYLSGERK